MRRYSGGLVSRRSRGAMTPAAALVAAALVAAAAAPAGATVTPVTHDAQGSLQAVQAAAGASFAVGGQGAFFVPAAPGNPVGIGTTAVPGFPRDGSTYLALSTGDASLGDQPDRPGVFPSVDDNGGPDRTRGDTALDDTTIQTGFNVPLSPAGAPLATCLSFDVRFLSEEYPDRITSAFTTRSSPSSTHRRGPRRGPRSRRRTTSRRLPFGRPLTIKSGGPAAMSPAEAAGTPYGAATPVDARPGAGAGDDEHTAAMLSLFDHGDRAYDSAVFIDNLRLTTPPGTCTAGLIAARPGRRDHRADGRRHRQHGDADAHRYGRQRGGRCPDGDGPHLQRRAAGRCAGADAGGAADRHHVVGAGRRARAGPVHGAGNAGQRSGRRRQRAHNVHRPARRGGDRRGAGGGSSSQQSPGDRDNDGIPDDQDTSDGSLPPVPGKTFDARVVSGDVFIKYPPGTGPRAAVKPPKGFVALKGAANIPMGAQLDTRKGRVAVTSAHDTSGTTAQTADFYDGIFQVKQSTPKTKPAKPKVLITDLAAQGRAAALGVRADQGRLRGRREEEEARREVGPRRPVGQRQGQVPHERQVQLGHRSRHHLVDPGSLRWDVDQGEARDGERSGLQAPQDGVGEGRAQLPRARRRQVQGREVRAAG